MVVEPLLPHQKSAIRLMQRNWEEGVGWSCLQHVMRSRKTTTVLSFLEWVRMTQWRDPFNVLVVCPPKVIHVWEEWTRHYIVGDYVTVMSSGALSSEGTGEIDYDSIPWDIVVMDELHQYRAYSRRYRRMLKLTKKAKFIIGMSGTMVDKDFEEMFYPITILSKGKFFGTSSKRTFRQIYCAQVDAYSKYSPWVVTEKAHEEFCREIKPLLHTYNDETNIAPPEHIMVNYGLSGMQEQWIRDIEDEKTIPEIAEWQPELGPAHRQDKRRQIESGFYLQDGDIIHRFESEKWRKLKEIAEKEEGQILVWYRYIAERDIIKRTLLKEVDYYCPKAFQRFQEGKLRILMAHPRAAGAGIDFSCADAAVFVTPNPSSCDIMQGFYRLSRVGSTEQKRCYHLIPSTHQGQSDYDRMWEKLDQGMKELYKHGTKD